ncbi:hypothetical protein RJT34_14708 [Clitoria ternatea]|uniref:Heat shock factor-binding protein 1-like n=1 Tax=Clitoria ternatea TaxID=43366 RepID=A0AAN9JT03_CLITE
MSGHDAEDTKQSTADLTAFVQNLLQQMDSLDEMGSRIEELEQSINELRTEMGLESTPSPLVAKSEKSPLREVKPETESSPSSLVPKREKSPLREVKPETEDH